MYNSSFCYEPCNIETYTKILVVYSHNIFIVSFDKKEICDELNKLKEGNRKGDPDICMYIQKIQSTKRKS
ncbi:hypothetical protein L2E82_11979 [Cichorium intybus]|uniref:Uncharacterized protein n=1 Tax=Cichorium intybus TaxID=13427 RepID=A0ACB9GFU4_CICIN|nr:hypothetical protein L2E82_11979 [Cichorium intybus]